MKEDSQRYDYNRLPLSIKYIFYNLSVISYYFLNMKFIFNLFLRLRQVNYLSRSSSLLQPAVLRFGYHFSGRRVADSRCQYQHVYLRDRTGVHPYGECGAGEDEEHDRLELWRLHSGSWWVEVLNTKIIHIVWDISSGCTSS